MTRNEALEASYALGAEAAKDVTKKTTVLVLAGDDYESNSKYKKAMKRLEDGQPIELWSEDDFMTVLANS